MEQTPKLLGLETLHTFVAIAETGSFVNAAKAVNRAPSAVTMRIKKLEEQLGASLFLRTSQTLTLTNSGEKLLIYAKRLLAMANEVAAQFRTPEVQREVSLGVPNDIAERALPRVLKEINLTYPYIAVNVTVGTSERLLERAQNGVLDLAIINFSSNSPAKPGDFLRAERTVWVGTKGGVAHKRDPLPLALYGDGCIWRSAAIDQLEAQGRPYRIAFSSEHKMMQRVVVATDLAIAPLPASYVTDDMVVLGEREGFSPLPSFQVRLIASSKLTPEMQIVIEVIKGVLAR